MDRIVTIGTGGSDCRKLGTYSPCWTRRPRQVAPRDDMRASLEDLLGESRELACVLKTSNVLRLLNLSPVPGRRRPRWHPCWFLSLRRSVERRGHVQRCISRSSRYAISCRWCNGRDRAGCA